MKTLVVQTLCAAILLTMPAHFATAQFEELVKRVPNSSNVLVMVDATEIYKSELARKQGWSKNRQNRFAAGLTVIPPDASKLILAAQIDWEFLRANWEAELVEFEKDPDLDDMAKRFGGSLDKISDLPAVALPDDTYFVQFSKDLFGVMTPANRQVVSRWTQQPDADLSPYLRAGVAFEDQQADIMFAFDLTDAISEKAVRQRLADSKLALIKESTLDQNKLAELLASIRGVMLGISFGTKANGAIRIDFANDAAMLAEIGKPLLIHVLGQQGIMIDEFEDWEPSIQGKTLLLKGDLTFSGLTRIASLVEPPTPVIHRYITSNSPEQSGDQSQSVAPETKEYFDSVNKLYTDLKRKKKTSATYAQIGYYYGKYAEKIAELPILGVDPEMLDYGHYVASELYAASDVIKDVGIRTGPKADKAADEVDGSVYYSGSTATYGHYNGYARYGRYYNNGGYGNYRNYGNYGYAPNGGNYYQGYTWNGVYYDAKLEEKRREHAKIDVRRSERTKGSRQVAGILSEIDDAKIQVRRAMTEKYKVQF